MRDRLLPQRRSSTGVMVCLGKGSSTHLLMWRSAFKRNNRNLKQLEFLQQDKYFNSDRWPLVILHLAEEWVCGQKTGHTFCLLLVNKTGCRPVSGPGAKRHSTTYVHTVKDFQSFFRVAVAKYPLAMVLGTSPARAASEGGQWWCPGPTWPACPVWGGWMGASMAWLAPSLL